MDEPENKMSTDRGKKVLNPFAVKKPKKRSIVERELETNLTSRFTSPVASDGVSTSRYGRARRIKTDHDFEQNISFETLKSHVSENTPVKVQSPIFKRVSNSPSVVTPKKACETSLDNIDNIYQANKALSRFNDKSLPHSASKKSKVYIRKDLIPNRDDDDDVILIKDLFSPPKSGSKSIRSNTNSTEKYALFKAQNGHIDNTSVVKMLDFDGNKRKKETKDTKSKNELFNAEGQCPYQVGDLVWARMGTFPFWPCIITRDPASELFVKKKLFGRVEHDILHVTFFADNGRHNWVVDNMLRKYMGPEEFISARQKFTPEDKKKDPRLYAAFFISEKKQSLWNASVEEAETIQREPKRLRIDIFNDILYKSRASKKQQKSGKVTRTDSDVSLSESLYDSLFSEDDSKTDEAKCSRSRSKNAKIDVSDVVTACLDNMAAKTGNSKIQRQSHMDRWLQKAKSMTPEKKIEQTLKTPVAPKIEEVTEKVTPKVEKVTPNVEKTSNRNKRKRPSTKPSTPVTKIYSLRRSYEPQSTHSSEKSEQESKVINELDTFDSAKNDSKDENVHESKSNTLGGPKNVDSTDCCMIISKDVPVIDLVSKEIVSQKNSTDNLNSQSDKVDAIDDLLADVKTDKTEDLSKFLEGSTIQTKTDHLSKSKTEEKNQEIDSIKSTVKQNINEKFTHTSESTITKQKNASITKFESNPSIAIVKPFVEIKDPNETSNLESKGDRKSEERDEDKSEIMDVVKSKVMNVDEWKGSRNEDCNSQKSTPDNIKKKTQSSSVEVCIAVTDTIKTSSKPLEVDPVEKKSPLKTNEMVSIPDFDSDDSNLNFVDFNTCDKIDLEHQKIGVKSINTIVDFTVINKNDEKINVKSNDNRKNTSVHVDDDLTDILMDGKCGVLDESGNSESILQIVDDLKDILNEKSDIKEPSISVNNNTKHDILKTGQYTPFDSKKPVDLKPIEIKRSNEPKSFLDEAQNTDAVAKDLATVNKVNFFREVSVDKPPDLIPENLAAKAELLKDIQEEINEDPQVSESDSLVAKTESPKFIQDEISEDKPDLKPDSLAVEANQLKDVQNASDVEDDDSDDEPSPEYEPLGDEITEDFRQHLKCIESSITDKKDDAQLVKVCEEIAIIEESKHKLTDLKAAISPDTSLKANSPIKVTPSPVKLENENDKMESEHSTEEVVQKPKEVRYDEVKIEPDNRESTKEIKPLINSEYTKCSEGINGLTILNSLKSPPGRTKSLSLKNNSPKIQDATNKVDSESESILNNRYKTIDQIEEIISSKREPKRLPIENGEVRIPEIKENGCHKRDETPDLNDDDFDIDDVSVNSEDSDISLPNSKYIKSEPEVPRRSLRSRPEKKGGLENPAFLAYYEMNVDNLMDEYPELSQDDLLLYCYQTFLYKENLKSDVKQIKQIEESLNSSIKGVSAKQETSSRKKSKKPQSQPKNTLENFFREKYKHAKKNDFDSETRLKSERSDSIEDIKPEREIISVSPVDSGIGSSKDSNEVTPSAKRQSKSPQTIELSKEVKTELINDALQLESEPTTSSPKTPKRVRTKTASPRVLLQSDNKRVPIVVISPIKTNNIEREVEPESVDSDSDLPLRQLRSKVLQENKFDELKKEISEQTVKEEAETASVSSDNEPLLRLRPITKTEVTNEDPEFLKYVEMKIDSIVDENPQLSYAEIQDYLRKVYIYEKNSKSETQKIEEKESSNLVKGLNQETLPPKKPRRRPKVEKSIDVDEIIPKEKPKRKTVQHYYNEAFLSDIEDELEVFEIFKTKKAPITVVSKAETSPKKESMPGIKTEEPVTIEETTEEINTLDEIELYFKQLITPKPSVFIGLIREKVCEICEDISNLIKCKGCNGMFHYDCVNKETPKEVDTPVASRGRKKKKAGRKRKSQENDNSDISEENISTDDILPESCTFDAANIEAQIEAKMKELLEKDTELHYDSYSSDDGIDWTDSVAGKCEIIDIKLKPRTPPIDYSNFKCNNCQKYSTPVCFVCKSAVSKSGVKIRQKCNVQHCFSYYHIECLDHWPQTQFNAGELTKIKKEQYEALTCPRHVCHTCVSDDPRGCKTRFSADKLAKCVRCPATYHSFNKCLPAGTQILTASFIICPRHYEHRPGKVPCHVNTGWCFICALGGSLICCEYCPTSFHAECLNIKPPDGNYMCEDCETGRLPLYGEMVWVKLGHYRWWPGVILHPSEIPDNIMAVNHGLGEFVVRFFGQYDHYWVNRGRVFPYQEGDSGRVSGQKSKIDADFTTAMEHAQRAFEILKNAEPDDEEQSDISASLLPPHYIKLKINKPVGSLCGRKIEDPSLSLTQCECNPAEIEPCGPNSQCLNRMLLTECGPTCRAGERCNNRAFEKRLYPKLAPYKAPHRGWGLKTLEPIKAGTFVIEYVGELIDEEEFQRRMRRQHEIRDENFYFLTLDKERMIDAGPKGNLARFMNHCCEPNCETQKWTVLGDIRVGLFAIDDIPANSEVTFNYNLECTGIEKKRCLCGAQRCSGYIGAKPKQDESQRKKNGMKRAYKKRKNIEESPSTSKSKSRKSVGRPPKPKELTDIEKDLLIIKSASSESKAQSEDSKKPKIDSISTEDTVQKGTEQEIKPINCTDEISSTENLNPKVKTKIGLNKPKTDTFSEDTVQNGTEQESNPVDCTDEISSTENKNSTIKTKIGLKKPKTDSISEDTVQNGTEQESKAIDCTEEISSTESKNPKLKMKIKIGNNTSEVVSMTNDSEKVELIKTDLISVEQVLISNNREIKNNLKRKIDSIDNLISSEEPSAKKQCDRPIEGD